MCFLIMLIVNVNRLRFRLAKEDISVFLVRIFIHRIFIHRSGFSKMVLI